MLMSIEVTQDDEFGHRGQCFDHDKTDPGFVEVDPSVGEQSERMK